MIAKKVVIEYPDSLAVNLAIQLEEKEQHLCTYGLHASNKVQMEVSELHRPKSTKAKRSSYILAQISVPITPALVVEKSVTLWPSARPRAISPTIR